MASFNRYNLILTTAVGITAFTLLSLPHMPGVLTIAEADAGSSGPGNQQRYGILGQSAPDLNLSTWIDGKGKPTQTIKLSDLRGKVIYLYFFQDWCPGCHSHGFPTLQTLAQNFEGDDRVALLAVQTVFEGKHTNTREKLRKNQIHYGLAIPMAHDGGDGNQRGLPKTMINYRSGGTPWTVIIDPDGKVVYNKFHIDAHLAIDLIQSLRRKT